MNQAIKLNPSFSAAVRDRGIAEYDKRDFDTSLAAADAMATAKPRYAMTFDGRGAAYENRRAGDRVIQEANPPIRINQYNAYAYSPDTFPPASPPLIAPPAPNRSRAWPCPCRRRRRPRRKRCGRCDDSRRADAAGAAAAAATVGGASAGRAALSPAPAPRTVLVVAVAVTGRLARL